MRFLLPILAAFPLVSCSGYQLGGQKPAPLAHVKSIHVPLFGNHTQFPRASVLATHSFLDALAEDGTYRPANPGKADARLEAGISSIRYAQVRSSPEDVLRSVELELAVEIHWKLMDSSQTGKILARGTSFGKTRFFVEKNLQTARANALPDALQRAALNIIAHIADGF